MLLMEQKLPETGFLHFGTTFWQYFSRKQPHTKDFFHESY